MASVQITITDNPTGKADFEFAFSEGIDIVNYDGDSQAIEFGRAIMQFVMELDQDGFRQTFKGYPLVNPDQQN